MMWAIILYVFILSSSNFEFSVAWGLSDPLLRSQKDFILKQLGLFGTLKLALALQFIVTNAYFGVACNTKVSVRATLK